MVQLFCCGVSLRKTKHNFVALIFSSTTCCAEQLVDECLRAAQHNKLCKLVHISAPAQVLEKMSSPTQQSCVGLRRYAACGRICLHKSCASWRANALPEGGIAKLRVAACRPAQQVVQAGRHKSTCA